MVGDTAPGELGVGVADVVGDNVPIDVLLEVVVVETVLVPGLLTLGRLVGSWIGLADVAGLVGVLGLVDVVGDTVPVGGLEDTVVGIVLVPGLLKLERLVGS